MPAGIGYGPLPPPPGLAVAPAALPPIPGLTEDTLIAPPAFPGAQQPEIAAPLIPAPVLAAEQPLPPPPVSEAPASAPVPAWLRQALEGQQVTQAQAAPALEAPTPTDSDGAGAAASALAGLDTSDPIALAQAGAQTRVDIERAALKSQQVAQQAIREAEQRTQQRLEEQAERQRQARERVAQQNAEIQRALREGPGTTWRDVAAAGIQAAAAMLGAAFDRSGTMQRQLPQIMESIVGQWQARTQGAFARQLQAMQVGREQAQDELDAAMDEERRIEAAGAASRTAILEEADRQLKLAVQEGRVSLAELEAAGIPAQMQAQMDAAAAKQAEIEAENQRKIAEAAQKSRQVEADIAYKQEQARSERADRAKQYADIDIARQRLALDKDRSQALKEQDRLDAEKRKLDILKEQGLIDDRNLAKAVPLPGGAVLIANDAERARNFSSQVASAEILGGLLDRIAVKLETGTDQFWASPEAQRLLSDYNAAVLATKDAEVLGAIQGADMGLIEGGLGPDPSKISLSNLRSQAPRIRQTRDNLGRKINARARAISSQWAAEGGVIELPSFKDPTEAVPETPEDARGMLLPGTRGERPRIGAGKGQVKPEDFDAAIATVRDVAAKSVGGTDRDAVVRVQAEQLVSALSQVRAERERVERERDQATRTREALPRSVNASAAAKEAALTEELRTLQEYEERVAEALKRERRLLWQKAGDPKLRGKDADRATLRRVEALIGPVEGKPRGGK